MDVTATLASAAQRFKTTTVEKQTPLHFDVGNLMAFDASPIDEKTLRFTLHSTVQPLSRSHTHIHILAQLFVLSGGQWQQGWYSAVFVEGQRAAALQRDLLAPHPACS